MPKNTLNLDFQMHSGWDLGSAIGASWFEQVQGVKGFIDSQFEGMTVWTKMDHSVHVEIEDEFVVPSLKDLPYMMGEDAKLVEDTRATKRTWWIVREPDTQHGPSVLANEVKRYGVKPHGI